ncbi:MAG: response regulator [Spirochaetes bacterium]|nr:response regulator [Spirochaetota bacterium]
MNYIMVIDDSPTIRTSVAFTVKDLGCEIKQAENGADALEKISAIRSEGNDVSLCIVDVNMPVMDGISFVKEFKKNDKFTPVLMLTTESEEDKIKEGKTAGAAGWMIKPFKPDNLKSVVEKLMV